MATFVVASGAVTSWAGTANTDLIADGAAPTSFNLTIDAPEFDQTAFNGSGAVARAYLRGIRSWGVQMSAVLSIPYMGSSGLVTATAASDGTSQGARAITGAHAWTMDIAGDEKLSTAFNSSGVSFESYLPGLINWGGTIETRGDDTVSPILPINVASATFKILENASSDHTLAGAIELLSSAPTAQVGEVYSVAYRYRGTGNLTAAGTSASGIPAPVFVAGTLARFAIGEIVLTAASGRTFTGDAFATQVSIRCAVNEPVTVNITARGTGALAVA